MRFGVLAWLLPATVLAPGAALAALEGYGTYEVFAGSGPIDSGKWTQSERFRAVRSGALNMLQREWGRRDTDTGVQAVSWGEDLAAAGRISQLKATVRVNAFQTEACAANTSPGYVRARLVGTFFNTGNPTVGSYYGDVIVQARIGRLSNSADAPGVLRVQGLAGICQDSNCTSISVIGSTVDLGTATAGQNVVLAMEWNKALKKFVVHRDNGATSGEIPYTVSDAAGPGRPLQALGNRIDAPNCTQAAVSGQIDASFDGVQVNKYTRP